MILLRNDGIVEPWGLHYLTTSRFELLPTTREAVDHRDEADGELDFRTMLRTGEIGLSCVSQGGLDPAAKQSLLTVLAGQFNQLRGYVSLVWESDQGRALRVRLKDKPVIKDHRDCFEVDLTLCCQPFWESTSEYHCIGSGQVVNQGTAETPVVIEIKGPVTEPLVTIVGVSIAYAGALTSLDTLIIDTEHKTAAFNGINALARCTGIFPWLPPGVADITMPAAAIMRWKERWI